MPNQVSITKETSKVGATTYQISFMRDIDNRNGMRYNLGSGKKIKRKTGWLPGYYVRQEYE